MRPCVGRDSSSKILSYFKQRILVFVSFSLRTRERKTQVTQVIKEMLRKFKCFSFNTFAKFPPVKGEYRKLWLFYLLWQF